MRGLSRYMLFRVCGALAVAAVFAILRLWG